MSRIGYYKFSTSCELHVVNAMGESCPVNDESVDAEIEVECVLHCDDPEDGVYAEDIEAAILIEDGRIELGEEAISLLDLSTKAGEVFMDSGRVPPKKGERYMDTDGVVWTVAGTGKLEDQAHFYIWLERSGSFFRNEKTVVGRTVDEWALDATHIDPKTGKPEPCYRRVVGEPPPPPGHLREADAVYDCPKCRMPFHPSNHTEDEPCWKKEKTDG